MIYYIGIDISKYKYDFHIITNTDKVIIFIILFYFTFKILKISIFEGFWHGIISNL